MSSFGNFPEILTLKTLDTSEDYQFCSFTTDKKEQTKHGYLWVYIHGSESGSERMRVKLFSDSAETTLVDTSDWVDLADRSAKGTYDINYIRFDFNQIYLKASTTYYARVETDNYTRNGDTFYIALAQYLWEDWTLPPANTTVPAGACVFGILGER